MKIQPINTNNHRAKNYAFRANIFNEIKIPASNILKPSGERNSLLRTLKEAVARNFIKKEDILAYDTRQVSEGKFEVFVIDKTTQAGAELENVDNKGFDFDEFLDKVKTLPDTQKLAMETEGEDTVPKPFQTMGIKYMPTDNNLN